MDENRGGAGLDVEAVRTRGREIPHPGVEVARRPPAMHRGIAAGRSAEVVAVLQRAGLDPLVPGEVPERMVPRSADYRGAAAGPNLSS